MTTHRFARELGAGTLDDAVAARYLVQDYAFVNSFVALLGYAIAYAPSMPSKRQFAQFAAAVTADENDFFLRSFRELEVPEPIWKTPELGPVTRDFIDLLQSAGRSGSYAQVLSVLCAAEWSYLTWAKACPRRASPAVLAVRVDRAARHSAVRGLRHLAARGDRPDRRFGGRRDPPCHGRQLPPHDGAGGSLLRRRLLRHRPGVITVYSAVSVTSSRFCSS